MYTIENAAELAKKYPRAVFEAEQDSYLLVYSHTRQHKDTFFQHALFSTNYKYRKDNPFNGFPVHDLTFYMKVYYTGAFRVSIFGDDKRDLPNTLLGEGGVIYVIDCTSNESLIYVSDHYYTQFLPKYKDGSMLPVILVVIDNHESIDNNNVKCQKCEWIEENNKNGGNGNGIRDSDDNIGNNIKLPHFTHILHISSDMVQQRLTWNNGTELIARPNDNYFRDLKDNLDDLAKSVYLAHVARIHCLTKNGTVSRYSRNNNGYLCIFLSVIFGIIALFWTWKFEIASVIVMCPSFHTIVFGGCGVCVLRCLWDLCCTHNTIVQD